MKLESLISELSKNGIPLPELDLGKLRVYASLLKEWNEKINLTSIVEEDDVVEKHFLDSLLPCALTDFNGKSIIDIGSGAGFPGMVIALAYPSCHVTLVDATRKKFAFLEEARDKLGLQNVSFHVGRVEEMKEEKESFDIITSRGFASVPVFLEVGTPLAKLDGEIILMRGAKGKEELKTAKTAMEVLGLRYTKGKPSALPTLGDVRWNFLLSKVKQTAPKYPRDWAKLTKHPL